MGISLSFGGSKKKEKTKANYWTPEQHALSRKLGPYIREKIGTELPAYPGTFVAPMSEIETAGQARLSDYLKTGTPADYQWTTERLKGIIDPEARRKTTQGLYESIKRQTKKDVREMQDELAEAANLRGMYFSGPHAAEQYKMLGETRDQLSDIYANLMYQDVRDMEDLTVSATPMIREAADLPIKQAAAATTIGALPRTLEQSKLTAEYQDWLRQQAENNPMLALALSYLGLTGTAETKGTTSQSAWQAGLGASGQEIAAIMAAYGMSSKLYKKNICFMDNEDELLSKVKDVPIYEYNYKGEPDGTKKHLGVMVENAPHEVIGQEGDRLDIVSYLGFLTSCVKALIKKVENLSNGTSTEQFRTTTG